LASSSSSQSP